MGYIIKMRLKILIRYNMINATTTEDENTNIKNDLISILLGSS